MQIELFTRSPHAQIKMLGASSDAYASVRPGETATRLCCMFWGMFLGSASRCDGMDSMSHCHDKADLKEEQAVSRAANSAANYRS